MELLSERTGRPGRCDRIGHDTDTRASPRYMTYSFTAASVGRPHRNWMGVPFLPSSPSFLPIQLIKVLNCFDGENRVLALNNFVPASWPPLVGDVCEGSKASTKISATSWADAVPNQKSHWISYTVTGSLMLEKRLRRSKRRRRLAFCAQLAAEGFHETGW